MTRKPGAGIPRLARVASVGLACAAGPAVARPTQESLCAEAHAFLVDELAMAAITEPDEVDDWRTRKVTQGCRITAAGLTDVDFRTQAIRSFDRLAESGWARSPDPRDAPNEASLRFRRGPVDCLFSFYSGGLLGTEAELEVDDARVPAPGERRFNFLVLCVPAREAVPRP